MVRRASSPLKAPFSTVLIVLWERFLKTPTYQCKKQKAMNESGIYKGKQEKRKNDQKIALLLLTSTAKRRRRARRRRKRRRRQQKKTAEKE